MQHKAVRRIAYAALIVSLVAACFLAGKSVNPVSAARAAGAYTPADGNSAALGAYNCTIDQITIFDVRFHFHCTTAINGISFFTYSTQGVNGPVANRMLLVANTAFSLGSRLWFGYDDDPTHNLPGCFGDCRNLVWVSVRP